MSDQQALDTLVAEFGGVKGDETLPSTSTYGGMTMPGTPDLDALVKEFGGVKAQPRADAGPVDLDALVKQFGGQKLTDLEAETIADAPPNARAHLAMPTSPAFFEDQHGVIAPPNIDLYAQPRVKNPDGTVSTVRSMSFEEDGHEILVPTVAADGSRILSDREAIDQYHRTGKHLGIYADPAVATAYAQAIHDAYAAGTYDHRPEPTAPAAEQPSTLQRYGRNYALTGQETPAAPPDLLTRASRYVAGGARQAVGGAVQASTYYSQPTEDTLRGANDLIEGALKVATPLAVAGAIVDLPGTLITLGTSWAAAKAAGKTAEVAGLSPEAQRFAENVAGATAALGLGTRQIQKLAAKATEVAGATARATALAAQLAGRPLSEAGPGVGNAVRPGVHAPLEVIDSGIPSTVRSAGNSAAAAPESVADVVRDSPAADAVRERLPNLSAEELDALVRQYGGTAHHATFLDRPVGVATVATRDTATPPIPVETAPSTPETASGTTISASAEGSEGSNSVSEPDAVTPPPAVGPSRPESSPVGEDRTDAERERAEAMAASTPFAYDLEQWKAEQIETGSSPDEVETAIRETTKLGIDPTKSDDLNDLEHFQTAVEGDEDWRTEQTELGHVANPAILTWHAQQFGDGRQPAASVPTPADMEPDDELPDDIAQWPDDQIRQELLHAQGQLDFVRKQQHTTPDVIAQAEANVAHWHQELDRRGIALEPQGDTFQAPAPVAPPVTEAPPPPVAQTGPKGAPVTAPDLLAHALRVAEAATAFSTDGKTWTPTDAFKRNAMVMNLKNATHAREQKRDAWWVVERVLQPGRSAKRAGEVKITVRTYNTKTGKPHAEAGQVYRFRVPEGFTLDAPAPTSTLPPVAGGRNVETTDGEPGGAHAGRPAGSSDTGESAGGPGDAGTGGVAGEQPPAGSGVPTPAQQARNRKRGARSGGAGPRRGAAVPSAGPDAGASAGTDAASHVDTADVADSQGDADAHARGERARWFHIGEASELTAGGATAKLEDNLAALRLLKQLQKEGRPASDAEQAVLARYIGWGHTELAGVVDPRGLDYISDPRKKQARQELDAILTPAEVKALGESTVNAHYSFAELPRAMWQLVEHLGLKGGAVLEPAVGTGHFLGTMPGSILGNKRTKVYGIDKEPIAAAIAQQLYQSAFIQASPLEDATVPDHYFDLVISNVPFGKIEIFDPAFVSADKVPMTRSIHNYYFGKALDVARPGGLILFITSRYTMDSQSDMARRYIAERATFLGAFRLPNQAFLKTAGTEVVTDVIVLQKHEPGRRNTAGFLPSGWMDAVERKELGVEWDERQQREDIVRTNTYFVNHPEMVLGKETRSGKMYGRGNSYNVEGTVTVEQLSAVVQQFPTKVFKASAAPPRKIAVTQKADTKQGSFVLEGGKLYTYDKGTLTPSPLTGKSLQRAKTFIPLRDAYQTVLDALVQQASDADLTAAQQRLRATYDAFVEKFGHVNLAENRRVIEADPNASRVVALENVDIIKGERGPDGTRGRTQIIVTGLADIFTKRLLAPPKEPTSAGRPQDALIHSLAWKGRVDVAFMQELTGKTEGELAEALVGEMYMDPATRAWQPQDEYLSGDVITKLAQAAAAAKTDPRYQANVTALTSVQPTPITIEDFGGPEGRSAPFGATWIPVPTIQRFLNAVGNGTIEVRLLNSPSKVEWYVEGFGRHEFLPAGGDYPKWAAQALNGELPTLRTRDPITNSESVDPEATERYRQSLGQLREQWQSWWKSDPDAASELVRIYNAMFNREAPRKFDGRHLVTPNSNPEIQLRAGQKDSVYGALQRGNTLLAQAVGWGKTYEIVAIAGEWKRLGLADKPAIVVPNHLIEQARRDFLKFYPAARVLVPEKNDFEKKNRQKLIARIANNDWDAVIMAQSQFLRISVKVETLRTFIKEQEDQLLAEGAEQMNMDVESFSNLVDDYGEGDKHARKALSGREVERSTKDIVRAILKLRARLKKRLDQQDKDSPVTFEELGIDGLIVDEAHLYKNLYFSTSKNNIVGLKGSDADRAMDMYLKVRHINKASNNRNVVFATGTPISNTMSELYTMFRYLAQPALDRLGMAGFDSWANAYAEAEGRMEPAPDGGYKERTRLRNWSNLRELSALFRRFADVVTTDDIIKAGILKLPTVTRTTIELEPHPQMDDFMSNIKSRIDALKTGKVDPRDDNHLKISTEAAMAAVDLRLVMPQAAPDPNSRMNVAAKEIAKRYRAHQATLGTQLVFLDIGVPNAKAIEPLPASIRGGAAPVPVAEDVPAVDEGEEATDIVDEEAESEAALDQVRQFGHHRDLYNELKTLLQQQGIPRDEIAFIHQATNPSEQGRLFQAVRDGKIRVLLASRSKGGTGMNVQNRVVALHHLDVPWRPDQLEQADGRAIRQGNQNADVEIVKYVTKKSFDEYKWGLLAAKQGFIARFMRGELGSMEDLDPAELDMQVASALASGDPRVLEMIQTERELVGLRARAENFTRRHESAKRDRALYQAALERDAAVIDALRAATSKAQAFIDNPQFSLEKQKAGYYGLASIKPRLFLMADKDQRAALAAALEPIMSASIYGNEPIATAGPYVIQRDSVEQKTTHQMPDGTLRIEQKTAGVLTVVLPLGPKIEPLMIGSTPEWNEEKPPDLVRSLDSYLRTDRVGGRIRQLLDTVERWKREITAADAVLAKTFDQDAQLKAKETKLSDLRVALGVEKAVAAAQPTEDAGGEDGDTHDHALPLQTAPPIARAAEALRAAGKDIRATLTAPTVSEAAKLSSRYLRLRLAQLTHTVTYANHALTTYRNAMERLTLDHDEILRLADVLETGRGELPKWLLPWAAIRNDIFQFLKQQIADLGIERQWREHYLGHVWEAQFKDGPSVTDRALRLIGRRPLEGPKSFLKHRTIPTMRQGVARGLEPKTWNLVEIDLFKIEEMSKFILGRQALNDNRSLGTWTFVSALRKPPTGMVQIPDPIGAVWAPPQITVKEAYDALLTEGLESLIHELGIPYGRVAGSMPWLGRTNTETNEITMRVGAPEGALMHELGHALDNLYGLKRIITDAIKTGEYEGDTGSLDELRELAKLRYAGGTPTADFAKYVQKRSEQIANLVHAYLWAPDEAQRVAPRAYDAFEAFVMDHEELHPLMELQKMRSVVIAEREATYRLPGPILLGRYYAAPEVARIFKNYLTPGLGAHPVFQVLRVPSNAMVQLKLSLSLFHMLTVSIEGTSMAAGRMMRDLLHGKPLAAVKQAAKVLVEPVDAAARGHAIRKQYLSTLDLSSLPWTSPTNLLVSGGGRVEQSREYTNRSMAKFVDNLRRANEAYLRGMHGRVLSESTQAAIRLLPAMIEAGAWPILQWFVPRVKSAAAVAEIQKDLDHLPGIPTEDTLLAIASKAVNLTDATLGEVIWDNYFLPRALMSAVQLVIMAPGWRGGSAVMLARGLTDPIRKAFPSQREDYTVRVPVSGGASGGGGGSAPPPAGSTPAGDAEPPQQFTTTTVKEPYWSSHTTFLIGQVFVAILIAELYQRYLHHAGHPRTVKDVAYPQTGKRLPNGEPDRSRIPGYAGIFYDILRHPPQSIIEYLIGGEAPFAAMLPQLWRNETSFGEQITEPGDPWSAQLKDYLTFLEGQLAPISVSSYGRRAGTPLEKGESVLGLSPAPRRITDTPLEAYLHQVLPPPHKTREQAERATERRTLREAIRSTPVGGNRPAVETSHLSPRDVRQTARTALRSPLPGMVQQLSMTQALHAYALASPEERLEIKATVGKKLPNALASTPPAERTALVDAYRKAMQLPVARRAS